MNDDCQLVIYENNEFKLSEFSQEQNNQIEFQLICWNEIINFLKEYIPNLQKGPKTKFELTCFQITDFLDKYILKVPEKFKDVGKTRSYLGYVNELVKFMQSRLFSLPFLYKTPTMIDLIEDLNFK